MLVPVLKYSLVFFLYHLNLHLLYLNQKVNMYRFITSLSSVISA